MQKITVHTIEGKHELLVPQGWHELTLGQLVAIDSAMRTDPPDVLKCFSILTGLNIELSKNLNDPKIEIKVFQLLRFLNTPPDWETLKHPQGIILKGVSCKIPSKVGSCMLGQKIMLLQALDEPEKILENTPFALAVMLQPYFDRARNKGKLIYNDERVDYYTKELPNMNGLEGYALAVFFFRKYKISSLIGKTGSQAFRQSLRKIKKLSRNWLKLTG